MTKTSVIFATNDICKEVSDEVKLRLAIKNHDVSIISTLIERNPSIANKNCDKVLDSLFKNRNSDDSIQQQIIKILKILIDQGMDVNITNNEGITLLHSAIEHKMQTVVEFLIESEAKIDFDDFPITYFFMERVILKCEKIAPFSNQLKIEDVESARFINWLSTKGFNFNLSTSNTGLSLFHLVIQNNLQNVAKTLLKYTGIENEMLHIYLETYKDLLESRFQEFYRYKYYKKQYSYDILKSMIDMGFSVNFKNDKKETAFHIAIKLCLESKILNLLLDKFSVVRATDKNRKTVLHLLIENYKNSNWKIDDYKQLLRSLLRKGSDITIRDSQGLTALQRAVMNGNMESLLIMKEFKAKFNVKTRDGKNLLHLVDENKSIVEFLIKEGVDINGIDKNGRSPLHMAASKKSKVYELLLKFGAYVDVVDNKGLRAFHAALSRKNEKMTKCLLKYGTDIHDSITQNIVVSMRNQLENCCLYRYLISLTIAELLYDSPYKLVNVKFSLIYEDCLREIKEMREFFIDKSTSLFDFLQIRNLNRKCLYFNNEKLKKLVDDDYNLEMKFPNYATVIQNSYRQVVARKLMLDSAELIWYDLTGIDLPNVCVRRVLMFLNTIELAIFSEKSDRIFIERRLNNTSLDNKVCIFVRMR